MLKVEQAVQVIEEYLSREGGGSLIVDTADGTVEWSMDSNAISHGSYVVVESFGVNSECDCGEFYNSECERCQERANYLLEKVEKVLG